jgi:hypothetical protein
MESTLLVFSLVQWKKGHPKRLENLSSSVKPFREYTFFTLDIFTLFRAGFEYLIDSLENRFRQKSEHLG